MNLALKYRPRKFSDVVGQKAAAVILEAMIRKQALSQALLFTGPSGVGKTSMARIIAAQLNSEGATDVHAGTHPAVLEIDAASHGNVEHIRQLKRDLNYIIEGHRVIILDEAHAMSSEAFAALLNLLEFPPPQVTFILITTEANRIPITIRHRCDSYLFKKASTEAIMEKLSQVIESEGFNVDSELVQHIAQRSEGSFREALMLLEQITIAEIASLAQYTELRGEADFGPALILASLNGAASALEGLNKTLLFTNVDEIVDRTVETLRDIIMLKGNVPLALTTTAFEARKIIARQVGNDQLLKAIRVLWDLQTKFVKGDPVRSLELAFSLIGDLLAVKSVETLQNAPSQAAMSIEKLRNYQA